MTNEQIIKEINKAIRLGRKEAYVDMFCIVSNMYVTDGSESLEKLLNILHKKVLSADAESEPQESDLGDYPDAIRNQFDNMTGSMNL